MGAQDSRQFYDGWSSFKRLRDNTPPLVIAWSNPLQIKLTPEVCALVPRNMPIIVCRDGSARQLWLQEVSSPQASS